MSAFPESDAERPSAPTHDQAEADRRRRAECAERISRLLSALDGGTSSGKTEYLTKEVMRETKTNPDSAKSLRFLLVDRNGRIGEFGSWEDASQYRNDLKHYGASIIGVEKKPLEPGAVREQPTNKPTELAATQPANLSAKPPAAQPTKPEAGQPTKPEATQPANTAAAQPAKPEATQPSTQPAGITGAFDSPNRSVIQELKKPDVPCDSRPNSIPKNTALPANSTVMRIVGKIFPAAAKTATLNACPQILNHHYELLVLGNSAAQNTNVLGFGNLTLTCAPPAPNYGTINIHYTAELTNAPSAPE